MTALLSLVLAAGLPVRIVPSAPGGTPPSVSGTSLTGRNAPDFDLVSLTGERVRLSDFRGKAVLLNFWATWCAPCRVEVPWLADLYRQRRRQGLEIVGVSMDDAGTRAVAEFVREKRVTYPILGNGKSIAAAYGGVRLLPQTFSHRP